MEKEPENLQNRKRSRLRRDGYISIRENQHDYHSSPRIPRSPKRKRIVRVSSIEVVQNVVDKKNKDLGLFNSPDKDQIQPKTSKEEDEFKNFILQRNWLHSRKKIKHSKANIRLCQKPPVPSIDGTKTEDVMQELRINQYGQYIQEKLGLFKRPTKLELMLYNYKKGKKPKDSLMFTTPEPDKKKRRLVVQKHHMSTEFPQRLNNTSLMKSIHLPKKSDHQSGVVKNTNLSERLFLRGKRTSQEYDDHEPIVSRKYKNPVKEILLKRSINAHSADKKPQIRLFKSQRNIMSTATESLRQKKHFKDCSITIEKELKSSREETKVNKKVDFLTVNENHSGQNISTFDKIKLNMSETRSIQNLRNMLHLPQSTKRARAVPKKMIKKINSKLINIFREPSISANALETASKRSIENMNSLSKIKLKHGHHKSKIKQGEKHDDKPKETFEAIMKRIMKQGINNSEKSSNDNLLGGDSLKLYKFFLNKLLNQSNDSFLCKKHHAFLVHQNMVDNGPSFYERMNQDITQRKNRDDSLELSVNSK
ncbi:unnamed protein product [Moneuplotes crassus]|uniref:Uncharacterized protein n=1 Tax=Euplotes crassus TaxID=5936 RepID=A0AAD1U5J1_EUPCR|nr:unnamed protein product [Moneuplotes crassus]